MDRLNYTTKRAKNFFISLFFKMKKKGKLLISHRYNRIPLLNSLPGGVLQELVV